jgi:hypothetical protein
MVTGSIDERGSGYNFTSFVRGGIRSCSESGQSAEGSQSVDGWSFLDLFSTSQTSSPKNKQSPLTCASQNCINNAPYFAFKKHDTAYGVVQGSCNSWNCPRCGLKRAKTEYGRIVEGCRALSEQNELWFITITCRGKEMSRAEAENNYLQWTNSLLTRWRTYATRHHQAWHYVQVTERQKRGHPHSHILTTWQPPEIEHGKKGKWKTDNSGQSVWAEKDALFSDYIRRGCSQCGLGDQYDLSRVQGVEGASRYVAKYLFKTSIFTTDWPKGWKRVRYSQSFPQLPEVKTDAFVLMTREDWQRLGKAASVISVEDYMVGEIVAHHVPNTNVILREKTK